MIIAIDIGGTNSRITLYNDNLEKINYKKMKTNPNNPKETLDELIEFINAQNEVIGIGISAPGPANYEDGIFYKLPNLPGWSNFKFIKYIKENTNVQNIQAQNDANLMALAQHFHFNGTKNDVTQFFTISTGLGAGLIIDNKIFTGPTGQAQEVANAPAAWIKESGKGLAEGSLEYFSSGSGLAIRGKKIASSTQELFEKYNKNLVAKKVIDEGIEAFANMLAITISLLNPTIIAFDGSVVRNNKWYVEKSITLCRERVFPNQFNIIKFVYSELGDDAALIGAYHLIKKGGKNA